MGDPYDDGRKDDARQQGGEPADACPFLGMTDDDNSHFSFPSSEHRCHSEPKRVYVELAHQGTYCLTPRHAKCFRYYAPDAVNAIPPKTVLSGPRPSAALPPRGGFGQLVETPKGWVPVATNPVDGPRFAAAGAAAAAGGQAGEEAGTPADATPADGLWASGAETAGPTGPADDPWSSRPVVEMPDEPVEEIAAEPEADDLPAPVLPAWAFGAGDAADGAGGGAADGAGGDAAGQPQAPVPHDDPTWPDSDQDAFREAPAPDSALWAYAERQAADEAGLTPDQHAAAVAAEAATLAASAEAGATGMGGPASPVPDRRDGRRGDRRPRGRGPGAGRRDGAGGRGGGGPGRRRSRGRSGGRRGRHGPAPGRPVRPSRAHGRGGARGCRGRGRCRRGRR